ncbi:MAG: Wall-associated protein, partial [Bacteroidota bacterium]
MKNSIGLLTTNLVAITILNLTLYGSLHAQSLNDVGAMLRTSMEATSSLYDARGFMKDQSRTVDGEVSVSAASGNVQYRHVISQQTRLGNPITLSLNYNQNATFKSFSRYSLLSSGAAPAWSAMTRNRPVWVLGVNGFAVQAFTWANKNVIHKSVQALGEDQHTLYNEDEVLLSDRKMMWLLEGYDYCNRMYSMKDWIRFLDFKAPNAPRYTEDVIKLLREDGSVLELVRREPFDHTKTSRADSGYDAQHPFFGRYVTTDHASTAYADVVVADKIEAKYSYDLLASIEPDTNKWPRYVYPRLVRYYPGDGTTLLFREVLLPYGRHQCSETSYTEKIEDLFDVQLIDATPTIFYLESIHSSSGHTIASFRYDGHVPEDGSRFSQARAGRANLIGFNEHTISYRPRGVNIVSEGRSYELEFDKALNFGAKDDGAFERTYDDGGGADDLPAPGNHRGMTWLLTRLIDPEGRVTSFDYENRRMLLLNTGFPRPISSKQVRLGHSYLTFGNGTDALYSFLDFSTSALVSVSNQSATYELKYWFQDKAVLNEAIRNIDVVTSITAALDVYNQKHRLALYEAYILKHWNASTDCSFYPVDYVSSVVCSSLWKYDRLGTRSMDGAHATIGKKVPLWSEEYHIEYDYASPDYHSSDTLSTFSTRVVRTTYGNETAGATEFESNRSSGTIPLAQVSTRTCWNRLAQKELSYFAQTAFYSVGECGMNSFPQKRSIVTTVRSSEEVGHSDYDLSGKLDLVKGSKTSYEYWPWLGNTRNIKSKMTHSVIDGKQVNHSKSDYSYERDIRYTVGYTTSDPTRRALVDNDFARPTMKLTTTQYRPSGTQWIPIHRSTSEFLNLFEGDRVESVLSYPNVTKHERLYRWRNWWKQEHPEWDSKKAEVEFYRPDSETQDTWLFYNFIDKDWWIVEGANEGFRPPDFMDIDDNDREARINIFPLGPPRTGLLTSEVNEDISDPNNIVTLSMTTTGYEQESSQLWGLPLTRTIYGKDKQRSSTETYEYKVAPMIGAFLLSKQMSSAGVDIAYAYHGAAPDGDPNSIEQGKTPSTMVTNMLRSGKRLDKTVDVLLGNRASLFNHLPTSQLTVVRKPSLLGGTDAHTLHVKTAYDELGGVSARIDENGFLHRYEYDAIGRLRTAWLPHDFPDPDAPINGLLPYDLDTIERRYPVMGNVSGTVNWKQIVCDSYTGIPTIRDVIPLQLRQFPADVIMYDLLEVSDGIRFVLGSREHDNPGCNVTRECGDYEKPPSKLSHSTVYCRIFPKKARYSSFAGRFRFKRSEHFKVKSANLHVKLTRTEDAMDCFPIKVLIRDAKGTLQNWDEYFVNCVSNDNVSKSGSSEALVVKKNYKVDDTDYDLVFPLNIDALGLETRHKAGEDEAELIVEISTTEDAGGLVYFSGADVVVKGDFFTIDDVSYEDFTLGYRYLDEEQRKVAIYAKIDDRSSTLDESRYPSLPNYILHPRHAKRRVTFTTDDLVQVDERGFSKDQTRLFASDLLPPVQKSQLVYDGAGRPVRADNALHLETTTTYDALGRVVESSQGMIVRGIDPTTTVPTVSPEKKSGPKSTTSFARLKRSDVKGLSAVQRERLGDVVDTELSVSHDQTTPRKSLKVYDERQRVVFSVDGYDPDALGNVDINLVTEYVYDNLDRVIEVINPARQVIRYTYDDFGNVASTEQVDMGRVDYVYDRHSRLRFSQTSEQRQRGTFTMRQYDDLGRPTIIGEAAVASLPRVQGRPLDNVDPDRLNIADDAEQHLPTVNTTMFSAPARAVPMVYTALPFTTCAGCSDGAIVDIKPPCADLLASSSTSVFNPAEAPVGPVLTKSTLQSDYQTSSAGLRDFEHIGNYPEFVLQAVWYDELPTSVGAIWGGAPQATVWDALTPTGTVRNLKTRPSIVAYRTHGGQPFHYIVRSYDERGRVECILRLTENLGFDAVYYSYNSMNKITSVHTVDARGQHATFYGYDEEGRVFRMWTATSERGFGPSMAPRKPELVSRPYAGAAGAEFSYDPLNAVTKIDYPQLNMSTTHSYNDAGMLLRSTTTLQGAAQPVHDEALWYSQSGLITDKLTREGANWPREVYVYDKVGRLTTVAYHPLRTYDNYQYDRAGNRTYSLSSPNDALIQGRSLTYTHTPGANHLTRVSSEPLPVGQVPQFMDELTYDPDGSMIARTKNRAEAGLRQQKIETFGYDAFNLIHVYN